MIGQSLFIRAESSLFIGGLWQSSGREATKVRCWFQLLEPGGAEKHEKPMSKR